MCRYQRIQGCRLTVISALTPSPGMVKGNIPSSHGPLSIYLRSNDLQSILPSLRNFLFVHCPTITS